jgi:hypothetical protein
VAALFGEVPGRAILACRPEEADGVLEASGRLGVGARVVAVVDDGGRLEVEGVLSLGTDELARTYREAIGSVMDR